MRVGRGRDRGARACPTDVRDSAAGRRRAGADGRGARAGVDPREQRRRRVRLADPRHDARTAGTPSTGPTSATCCSAPSGWRAGMVDGRHRRQHHERDLDRGRARRARLRGLRRGQGRRHQLHEDRCARAGAARHPGQRARARHHPHRGASRRSPHRAPRSASATPSRWAGPATSTRWPAPRCSSPRTWRATSPARRSTSTAAPTPPAAGTTTPRPASTAGPLTGARPRMTVTQRRRDPRARPRRVIAERGPEKFTMSAIAAAAGVSRPTLYRWFPTKDDLLEALTAYEEQLFDARLAGGDRRAAHPGPAPRRRAAVPRDLPRRPDGPGPDRCRSGLRHPVAGPLPGAADGVVRPAARRRLRDGAGGPAGAPHAGSRPPSCSCGWPTRTTWSRTRTRRCCWPTCAASPACPVARSPKRPADVTSMADEVIAEARGAHRAHRPRARSRFHEGLVALLDGAVAAGSFNELGHGGAPRPGDRPARRSGSRSRTGTGATRRSTSRRSCRRCSASGCPAPARPRSASSSARTRAPARLLAWESGAPTPPPDPATYDTDPRIAAAAGGMALIDEMAPKFKTMLPSSPTGPTECLQILALDFRSAMFGALGDNRHYEAWTGAMRHGSPPTATTSGSSSSSSGGSRPGRGGSSRPAHMDTIDALLEVYPDARFVMTHRDIAQVIPSVVSLLDATSRVHADRAARLGLRRQPGGVLGTGAAQDAGLPRRRERATASSTSASPRCAPTRSPPSTGSTVARRRAHRRRRRPDAGLVGDEPGRQAGRPRLHARAVRHRPRRAARRSSRSTTTGSRRPPATGDPT